MNFSEKPYWQTQQEQEVEVAELEEESHHIVVFNDDVNTFDHVIKSLIEVCEHTPIQAEQCTVLIHYKGKCEVLTGDYDTLRPRCSALLERGLSAEIM